MLTNSRVLRACLLLAAGVTSACSASGSDDGPTKPGAPSYAEPGTRVDNLALPAEAKAELTALEQKLAPLASLTAASLAEKRALTYAPALGYDPMTADNLDLIQGSSLALDGKELDKLRQQGFVIAPRHRFPHMAYGYKTIYGLDLPVYVSLDAILDTVHLSYDAILKNVETSYLTKELTTLLTKARERLGQGVVRDAQTAKDLDLYFAIALSLLEDETLAPVAGASTSEISQLVAAAKRGEGIKTVELFGARRDYDFSQLEPRGHYTDTEELKRYFRASMWLGRTDFRLIETQPNGTQIFRRRQLEAVVALRDVVQGAARDAFDHVDAVISAFVGEHDYMQLHEVDALLKDLGAADASALAAHQDDEIARTIVDKGYGAQRIASQVIYKDALDVPELPLDRSFALLGQRYTVDSHVFSSVVYDRVEPVEGRARTLPVGLDAAYGAFGNDAALALLVPELESYRYAPQLERVRTLVDAHGEDYWGENLYNLWLSSLRAISPTPALVANAEANGLPKVTGTEAWQRRLLNTQLASWAELRHDTILYVKQSYTSGVACEFPDGYVDPYPEAFERLRLYALKGAEVMALVPDDGANSVGARAQKYFAELASVSAMLRSMAEHERTGMPFDSEQMAFLNDAVKTRAEGCGGPVNYTGWFGRLLFDPSDEDMDPTIADVHTNPGVNGPAQVLHVGTGLPRLMVVTAPTCEGVRAYAGLASAYHEVVTGLDRLTDPEWEKQAKDAEDVAFVKSILP